MILPLSWFPITMQLCFQHWLRQPTILLRPMTFSITKSRKILVVTLGVVTRGKTRRAERKTRRARKGHVVEVVVMTATAVTKTWSKQSSSKEAMRNSAKWEASSEMTCMLLI